MKYGIENALYNSKLKYLLSFKGDCHGDEDAASKPKVWDALTNWVKRTFVDTKDYESTQNNVGNDEKKIGSTQETKEVVEHTLHAILAKDNNAQSVSN